eukprot:1160647-Pelagomonas_calceolata.AAC.8
MVPSALSAEFCNAVKWTPHPVEHPDLEHQPSAAKQWQCWQHRMARRLSVSGWAAGFREGNGLSLAAVAGVWGRGQVRQAVTGLVRAIRWQSAQHCGQLFRREALRSFCLLLLVVMGWEGHLHPDAAFLCLSLSRGGTLKALPEHLRSAIQGQQHAHLFTVQTNNAAIAAGFGTEYAIAASRQMQSSIRCSVVSYAQLTERDITTAAIGSNR